MLVIINNIQIDFFVHTHKCVGTVYIVIVHEVSMEIRNALRIGDFRERILVFIKLLDD
jgi:hypothetical protein